MDEEQDPFADIGAGDRIRKPERWNTKQWLVVVLGLTLMTLGALVMIGMMLWRAEQGYRLTASGLGAGLCALGYALYRKHWALRDR
jgi:hypothetical protein